jgi:DNA repair exonuclease SbcCD nuclease subunit
MFRLALLSDLHYGQTHFFSQPGGDPAAERLVDSLAAVIPNAVNALVFAGDFFSDNQPSDVQPAEAEVNRLLQLVAPVQTLAVPGNHDVTWLPALRDDRLYFYNRLIDGLGPPVVSSRASDLPALVVAPSDHQRDVAFLLLDSCRLENEVMGGLGRVTTAQLQEIENAVDDQGISSETHLLVAILHHHLLPVAMVDLPRHADPQEGPYPRVSVTVDAVEVLRRLAALGVGLILHGHEHRRAIIDFRNRAWIGSDQTIHVIAAGSSGALGVRRQFFLVEIGADVTTVSSFAQHPDNEALFGPDAELPAVVLPLGLG